MDRGDLLDGIDEALATLEGALRGMETEDARPVDLANEARYLLSWLRNTY